MKHHLVRHPNIVFILLGHRLIEQRTACPEVRVSRLRRSIGFLDHLVVTPEAVQRPQLVFDRPVVVGGDETKRHKPEPEPLLVAAKRLGVDPDECAYVGDSPFDIRAAKAAGMHAIAVTWGGIHTRERLEPERPDAIVDSAEELLAVL